MALPRKEWDDLSPAYRSRLIRHGIGAAYYRSGGNLQLARGHKYKQEHILRRERNPRAMTSADYRFIKHQAERHGMDAEEFDQEFGAWYRTLTPTQRILTRGRVQMEHRAYIKRRFRRLRKLETYIHELKTAYPFFREDAVAWFWYH
jgi:hypothetical protein